MISLIKPFNRFEWMIAMRYLRSKRSDGGISSMTWISFIGISLAVFALIATLAVRTGFRTEFVGTILKLCLQILFETQYAPLASQLKQTQLTKYQ